MNARILTALLCSTAILSIGYATPVKAQQAAQATAAGANGLEEIVVTARRREERIQSVPIAITAFSQAALEKNNIASVEDLQNLVPSLTASSANRDTVALSIRGQGGFSPGGSPSVTSYINEVPTPIYGLGSYYDLQSVEVLKGPQGTLFGQNSVGGAITLVSKRPTNDFGGHIEATFGNYGDKEIEGALNIPIVEDKVLFRVAGEGQLRDGYTTLLGTLAQPNKRIDLDNRQFVATRASLTFRPSDDIQNDFIFDDYLSNTHGSSFILGAVNAKDQLGSIPLPGHAVPLYLAYGPDVAGLSSPNIATVIQTYTDGLKAGGFSLFPGLLTDLAQQQALGPRTEILGRVADPNYKVLNQGFTDIFSYDINDAITFRNILAYRITSTSARTNSVGGTVPLLDFPDSTISPNVDEQYTEEPQFRGKSFDDKLTWTLGGYFERDPSEPDYLLAETIFGSPRVVGVQKEEETEAIYTQGTYDLSDFVEGLKFTGGYRYTWDYRYLKGTNFSNGVCAYSGPPPKCELGGAGSYHAPTWTVDFDYQLTPDTLAYVTSRRGYRSGGFNNYAQSASANTSFAPEYVTDLEVGLKSTFEVAGMQARTNIAAYRQWYDNVQLVVSSIDTSTSPPTPISLTVNAASAELNGVEFEGSLVPTKGLELTMTYAYGEAAFTSFYSATAAAANTTYNWSNLPKHKITIGADYHLPVDATLGDISLGFNFLWQDHFFNSTSLDPLQTTPDVGLLNVQAQWNDVLGQPVDLSFFMTNATDRTYGLGGFEVYRSVGTSSLVYNEPRMFGFRMRYRFGAEAGAAAAEQAAEAYTPPPVQAPAPAPKSYLVFFDFNKSDLTPQAVTIVDQAAHNAGPAKVTQLTVTGHTDTVGSDAYNMRLSRRRAESVAAQLEKDGISSSEIAIVAKGKRDLLVPTADGVKEPQNRRVTIVYDGGPSS
jgi:iron complex outermembrane receptor protein